MAGAALESELATVPSHAVEFHVASQTNDAEIRRLLRESPMAGRISLTFEREPDYFTDARIGGETRQTIVARNAGRVVCVGQCSVRERFVNGVARRVGYLGGLRLDARFAGRFDIVRRGYEFFRELQTESPADFYFTSIAADNQRARRFLERNIRGIPKYEFVGDFVTLIISTEGKRNLKMTEREVSSDLPDAAAVEKWIPFLNSCNARFQFAPSWDAQSLAALEPLGLNKSDFCVTNINEQVIAGGAVWDQRSFKQTVVRGYAPPLAWTRLLFNAAAPIHGQPRLPRVGGVLAAAFVSHLAMRENGENAFIEVINRLRRNANERGIAMLVLGFADNDQRLAAVRRSFRGREYYSRLYLVRWPGIGGGARDLDNRILGPEVSLL